MRRKRNAAKDLIVSMSAYGQFCCSKYKLLFSVSTLKYKKTFQILSRLLFAHNIKY